MTIRALLLAAVLLVPLALLPLRATAPLGARAARADRRQADGGDPVAALASPVRSRTWDLAFWTGEHAAGTAVWRRAVAACKSPSAIGAGAPGCTAVRLASWWGPTPLPPPVELLAAPFAAAGAEVRK